MRNSSQETIADIVAEMRSNEFDDPSFNVYSLVAARTLARGWADRIEAAVNQPVTNCNRLGNAAAMRVALDKADKALTRISKSAWFMDSNLGETIEVMEAGKAITTALSAPPRNCDIYDAESCRMAYHLRGDGQMTMQAFADWLFAPAEEGAAS